MWHVLHIVQKFNGEKTWQIASYLMNDCQFIKLFPIYPCYLALVNMLPLQMSKFCSSKFCVLYLSKFSHSNQCFISWLHGFGYPYESKYVSRQQQSNNKITCIRAKMHINIWHKLYRSTTQCVWGLYNHPASQLTQHQ